MIQLTLTGITANQDRERITPLRLALIFHFNQLPPCPEVAFFSIFNAAILSLSSIYPHEQTWVLTDRDFSLRKVI